jgi:hypothetical protein
MPYWVRRFIRFHGMRRDGELGTARVEAFLTQPADEGNIVNG